MGRVQKGEQERHGHRFGFGLFQKFDQCPDGFGRKVLDDCAGVIDALRKSKAQLPGGQGRGPVHLQVVEFGAALATDLQHVFEPHGGHQGRAGALAFQQGVGGDRGTVDEFGGGDARFFDPLEDALGGVVRR